MDFLSQICMTCQARCAVWFTKRVKEICNGYLIPVNLRMGFHVIQNIHYNFSIEHWPSKTAAQKLTAEDGEAKRKASSFTVNLQRCGRKSIFILCDANILVQRQNCSSYKYCLDSISFSLSIGITKKKIPKLGIQIKEYIRSARLHSAGLWQCGCF